MRIPRSPSPPLEFLAEKDADQIKEYFDLIRSPEVTKFVHRANDKYLHWDKLRHYPMPESLEAEAAWSALMLSRMPQFQAIPISFKAPNAYLRYWTPPQHHKWLHEIDQGASGSIGSTSGHVVQNERHLINSLMEEAIASSQLEGAVTTRQQAKKILRAHLRPRNESEHMIVNNYRAIMRIRRTLKTQRMTPRLLLQLHRLLTTNTLNPSKVGRFRTETDDVVVEDTTGEIIHDPPHASSVEERIKEICAFANTQGKPFVHPVTKAIILHFAIGFVHPFVDGNGRTARAVFYWYMLKHDYWLFEYLPISRIFLNSPVRYARAFLYSETDYGDVTYFIHYHLKVIVRAIAELHAYIEDQQTKFREAAALLRQHPSLNHRQIALLRHALSHQGDLYTIQQHQGTHGVTYATARSDILGLVEMGLLAKLPRGGRQMYFEQSAHMLKRLQSNGTDNLS